MSEHELQHSESPTWCVHCGTFDIWCKAYKCHGPRESRFDTRIPENAKRIFIDTFGATQGKQE